MHYFVSDIHLGAGDKAMQKCVEARFVNFLKQIENDAETLFLVGDIFDFWFEYKRVVPQGFVRVLGRLAELSDKGVKVVMITGNHDMWVGDYLTRECGVEVHTVPQCVSLAGKELFVAHGDNMNIKGQPMLRLMNRMFRSQVLRKWASRIIHPDSFIRFGKWWSGKSRKSHSDYQLSEKTLEPLVNYAAEYSQEHNVDYFIFGHLHYPADVKGEQRVLFMGDWSNTPSYLALDDNGNIELKIMN